jgi:hypothetical protein
VGGLSVHALQISGGLACFVATMLAWWVSWQRLAPDRTHFISEVLAIPWWQHHRRERMPGFVPALAASMLLGAGALAFSLAAAIELRGGWTVGATCSALTGALLLAIVVFPLREVPPEKVATARGLDLLHPFFAAVFYLVAMVTAVVVAWPHAGTYGTILAAGHVITSLALTLAVLGLSPRALGAAAFRPFYLPGVRILLDRRPAYETPTEWVRRLQWPATIMVALDLGITPTGF